MQCRANDFPTELKYVVINEVFMVFVSVQNLPVVQLLIGD